MFSSLPSASKIYVKSSKPRQKSSASSKGRRRKIHSTSSDIHNTDATLVSQTESDFEFQAFESQSEISSDIHRRLDDHALTATSCNADSVARIRRISADDLVSEQFKISSKSGEDLISEQCPNDTSLLGNTFTKSVVNADKLSTEVDVSDVAAAVTFEVGNVLESVITDSFDTESLSENLKVETHNPVVEKLQQVDFQQETTTADNLIEENISENQNTENNATDDLDVKDVSINDQLSVENVDEDQFENKRKDISAKDCFESVPPSNDHAIALDSNLEDSNEDVVSDCALIESDFTVEVVVSGCENSTCPNEDGTSKVVVSLMSEGFAVNHCDEMGAPKLTDPLSSTVNEKFERELAEKSLSPEPSELSGTESVLHESSSSQSENKSTDETTRRLLAENVHLPAADICQSYSDLGSVRTSPSDLKRCSSYPTSLEETSTLHKNVVDKATVTVDSPCQYCGSDERLLHGQNGSRVGSEEQRNNGQNGSKFGSEKERNDGQNGSKAGSEEERSLLASIGVNANLEKESNWNVLPPLTTAHARARSYVFGSTGHMGSLLGSEELNRFFPDNRVTIFVGTWNMNSHNPPRNIDDFLLPLDVHSLPDIYAIGVQESMQSKFEWDVLVQSTLGPSHVLFASSSLGVLHLSVYIKRDLIWFCSEAEEASVATRPGTMVKTKGAVAVCFMFFGTSLLFVNSHLAAHEQKLKERLLDYEKICSGLDLPKSIPLKANQKEKDVTSRFDVVLWCGDLNFRLTRDRPSVLSFVEQRICKSRPSCSFLVKHDQLFKAMQEGAAFHGFKEGVIHFNPSYKFDVGTNTFNSTKLRVPSYTDRILYRSNERSSVTCLHYDSVPDILTSDHKPVFGVFKVNLRPGRDNVPLAAGMFKRDIYLEAIKRRTQFVGAHQSQSTICNIM